MHFNKKNQLFQVNGHVFLFLVKDYDQNLNNFHRIIEIFYFKLSKNRNKKSIILRRYGYISSA